MQLLAIDPAIGSLGWAYWAGRRLDTDCAPLLTGLVRCKDQGEWWQRAHYQTEKLIGELQLAGIDLHNVKHVICEMPIFFSGTGGGVAAVETGSLQKLCVHIGTLAQAFQQRGIEFELVTVREWKGQLPKEVVIQRLKKMIPRPYWRQYEADIWDAIGIGLWKKGVFNNGK